MKNLDGSLRLYVLWSFFFIAVLIIHFCVRRWAFAAALRWGWLVYSLGIPAAAISALLAARGQPWTFWLAGFLQLAWSLFGFTVEYILHIAWRDPPRWPVLAPYIILYLAMLMFYWWPLWQIYRPLWVIYGALYAAATWLNVASHHPR